MKQLKNRFDGTALVYIVAIILAIVIYSQMGSTVTPGITLLSNTSATTATGTFTFSGNVSNGELVNITYGTAIYRFEFNTTGNGSNTAGVLTTNAIRINLSMEGNWANVHNTSILASGNLTAAINANASTAALVTAVNTTNLTTLTADTVGTAGNSITLSDNGENVIGVGLTGGIDGNNVWSTQTLSLYNTTPILATLAYWLIPLIIIIIALKRVI